MLTTRLSSMGETIFSYKIDEGGTYQIGSYPVTGNCQLTVLGLVGDLLESVADIETIKTILKELTEVHWDRQLALVDIHDVNYEKFVDIVKDTIMSDSTYHSTSGSTMHVIVFNASNLI